MEMSIDEVIYILENGLNIDGSWQKALSIALDTMRKYQKITEIVEEWSEDEIDYEGHYGDDYMEKIQEVIEDGKID